MKRHIMLLATSLLFNVFLFAQQKKSGIINFSISGYQHAVNATTSDHLPDLLFIGDATTELRKGIKTSDSIVRYTEMALEEFLGYPLEAVNTNRSSLAPDQVNGNLWVMETITEKKAFKQLGYQEVIEIECRIGSSSQLGRSYKPFIEVFIKIKDQSGKTVFKKREKLKINEKIPANQVEQSNDQNILSISFSKKSEGDQLGITSHQLLDWYKQVLDNALIKSE